MNKKEVLFSGVLFFSLMTLMVTQGHLVQYGALIGAISAAIAAFLLWRGLKLLKEERDSCLEAESQLHQTERVEQDKNIQKLEIALVELQHGMNQAASAWETASAERFSAARGVFEQIIQENTQMRSLLGSLSDIVKASSATREGEAEQLRRELRQNADKLSQDLSGLLQSSQSIVKALQRLIETGQESTRETVAKIELAIQTMMDDTDHMDRSFQTIIDEFRPSLESVSENTDDIFDSMRKLQREMPDIGTKLELLHERLIRMEEQLHDETGRVTEGLSRVGEALVEQNRTCLELSQMYKDVTEEDMKVFQELFRGDV